LFAIGVGGAQALMIVTCPFPVWNPALLLWFAPELKEPPPPPPV